MGWEAMDGFKLNGSPWLQGGQHLKTGQDEKQREQWPNRWGGRPELGQEQEK